MRELYLVQLGDDDERARRRAEQEVERARIRRRYVEQLIADAELDSASAERTAVVIFDHLEDDGTRCMCGCHPQLSSLHEDGTDCRCTWSRERREAERHTWLAELRDSEWAQEMRTRHEVEEREIREWLAGQVAVTAERSTSFAPEQWEGTVDQHSLYFRERHGEWRLELNPQPSGRFAQRLVDVDEHGRPVTEPKELTEGEVIAEGVDQCAGPESRRAPRLHRVEDPRARVAALLYTRGSAARLPPVRRADVTIARFIEASAVDSLRGGSLLETHCLAAIQAPDYRIRLDTEQGES